MIPRPELRVGAVDTEVLTEWRQRYRAEMNAQIVHDSWPSRGFTDVHGLFVNGEMAGYALVGGPPGEPRDIVKEFYVRPERRPHAGALFQAVLAVSGAHWVEAQTNDRLLMPHFVDCVAEWSVNAVLFEDAPADGAWQSEASFSRLTAADRPLVFAHAHEPVGEWGLTLGGRIVATGGLAFHYNPPYADIYMEVDEPYRRQGLGATLVRELKRLGRASGYVPAARCRPDNEASRRTLLRAGMAVCAHVLRGRVLGSPHGQASAGGSLPAPGVG